MHANVRETPALQDHSQGPLGVAKEVFRARVNAYEKRDVDVRTSTAGQHPIDLGHQSSVVEDVLQNVQGQHDVEAAVRKGQPAFQRTYRTHRPSGPSVKTHQPPCGAETRQ